MSLEPGTSLGPYEVVTKIGEGGMGEVYRARDTKLDRDVALKVLPQAFTEDPDRLARFEREAKVLASLNHPNIGHIYGLEEAEGQRALVLELIEGPTLADRIKQGPIPVDEALPIAKQIAEALEAAHEQGVIHRDLKPANIKIRPDGTVKVLDFGLAKAFEPEAGSVSASMSPTISLTAAATQMGMVIGTAAYMAPEQAKGLTVDKRADIWAYGAVLFEMLTGKKLFEAGDVSEMLASVLIKDPDISSIGSHVPDHIRSVVRQCLVKDPKERLRDIGDVRLAMKGVFETTVSASGEPGPAPQLQVWQRPISAALLVLVSTAAVGLVVWAVTRPDVISADLMRFAIVPPDTARMNYIGNWPELAISPDGTQIVYKGPNPSGTGPVLNLRSIDQLGGAPLRGGEGGVGPFVSPEGEWVGFTRFDSTTTLQKVSIFGGPPVTLTESPFTIFGASWGIDDQIVFGTSTVGSGEPGAPGLFRVSGGGGEPEPLTTLDTEQGETSHTWPFIIPGREAVLFVIGAGQPLTTGQLAVLDLATAVVTRLGLAGVSPRYVPTGHLVYAAEDGSVRAAPFDATSLEVTGNPVPLVESVVVKASGGANFSISDNGRLVYALGGGAGAQRSFVWVDRDGGEEPVAADRADYQEFNLSPDGERVAVRIAGDDPAVWIYDLIRDITTRLTFESDNPAPQMPTWTPDGTRVAFGTPLAWKRADGTGDVEILSDDAALFPVAFSPDGTTLVTEDRAADPGLGMLTLEGDRASTVLLDEEFAERNASLSPDGRWVAYTSSETGQREVYVRPFPDVETGKWQISTDAGEWPLWNPAGDELFYRGPTGVMAQEFEADPRFTPRALTLVIERGITGGRNRRMAVSPDGQRFLFLTDATGDLNAEDAAPAQINVVLNWHQELLERVPIP